ncbi:MAG: hypothetical protein MI717_08840, partial [Spirochaetales bacterium]|nr:hypothetical protein [Spirochaetales bacterium]
MLKNRISVSSTGLIVLGLSFILFGFKSFASPDGDLKPKNDQTYSLANLNTTELTINIVYPENVCYGEKGSIALVVESGVAPFNFLWSTGDTDQELYDVDPGTYSVTV